MGLLYEIAKKIRDAKSDTEVKLARSTVMEEDSDDLNALHSEAEITREGDNGDWQSCR